MLVSLSLQLVNCMKLWLSLKIAVKDFPAQNENTVALPVGGVG